MYHGLHSRLNGVVMLLHVAILCMRLPLFIWRGERDRQAACIQVSSLATIQHNTKRKTDT